ncbi:GT2 family glycosyltransferase [Alkalibaculum bacchi]|uniref:GT2 family glycosyltransferase n=2 Tax=Alkalibaculum bacchi TaxID=645887 RepID=A0A366HYP6_9FIRM|nr:GT2 family glycosyltransferase [Alkalibaculum bacchi]
MISVVIPTHNRVNLLGRAIKSAQEQTIKDIEIIVVSDGSTDGTDDYMKKNFNNDHRIKYISYNPSRNGNYARNKGIEASIGDYVAFLDDDDIWEKDKLEKQLNVIKADNRIGLVYTGLTSIYVNEGYSYVVKPELEGDISKDILMKNYIGTTSTVMVKKEIFAKSGMFDENLMALQDYDLWIRICQYTKVGIVKDSCIKYYNYTNKMQISKRTEKYEETYYYLKKKYAELFERLSSYERNIQQKNYFLAIANLAMRNGSRRIATKYSSKALKSKLTLKGVAFLFLSIIGNYKYALMLRKKFNV